MSKSVNGEDGEGDGTTPICRCRVLYLGSAVPHITKDGLQGIQEPLRDLYPEQGVLWNTDRDQTATGIDSWLSVWSNGILVENVDDKGNTLSRFHPIESLHYCAAVRFVSVPSSTSGPSDKMAKFLPLDSPFSKNGLSDMHASGHPPLFACILRRTSGIKVLECHAFICKKDAAANALVRCCFHAYADTMHARQIEMESPYEQLDKRRSRSIGSHLDSTSMIDEKISNWQKNSTGSSSGTPDDVNGYAETRPLSRHKARTPSVMSLLSHTVLDGNDRHANEPIYYNGLGNGTLRSVRSFISLATLKSQKKNKPRQMPIQMAPPPPPPVMFATLSKKELKKALKKESTLKRKHKYKDYAGPMMAPHNLPLMYGPMPPHMMAMHPPPLPPHSAMQIYGTLPPPGSGGFLTLDRKGKVVQQHFAPPNGHPMQPTHEMLSSMSMSGEPEPIYMQTAMPSPGNTLRSTTPHGEPIYFDGRPQMPPPHYPPGPPPMFVPHPQTGNLVPCTLVPTLSRKELKELEKQNSLMKKAAKKELKKQQKSGKLPVNGHQEEDLYQVKPPFPPEYMHEMEVFDRYGAMLPPDMHPSMINYNGSAMPNGGIYKKKGHLNERAFSYSIRQEHRSRSNSLSNLVFENGPNGPVPVNGDAVQNGNDPILNGNASSASLKSMEAASVGKNGPYALAPPPIQYEHANGNGPKMYSNGRMMNANNGMHHHGPDSMQPNGIDPNYLAQRMSNLKLNHGSNGHLATPPPPPPPLPPNGYQYQKTATIKRL